MSFFIRNGGEKFLYKRLNLLYILIGDDTQFHKIAGIFLVMKLYKLLPDVRFIKCV